MSIFNIFKKIEENQVSQSDFYNNHQLVLPDNFAQMVMELQMQLEFLDTYNMEVIQQLNQLYRIGIEYYINIDDKKANHFKTKLTSLLTHPNTLEIIQKKPPSVKQLQINSGAYTKNLKQQLGKFNCQSQVVVKSMMEGTQKKIEKHNKLIRQNLTTQQKKLQRRLEERSRSKSGRNKNNNS